MMHEYWANYYNAAYRVTSYTLIRQWHVEMFERYSGVLFVIIAIAIEMNPEIVQYPNIMSQLYIGMSKLFIQ